MIKVIEQNKVKRYRVKCPNCNNILDKTKDDIKAETQFNDLFGEKSPNRNIIKSITCPVCERIVPVWICKYAAILNYYEEEFFTIDENGNNIEVDFND